jgi:CBS domain-containing protein
MQARHVMTSPVITISPTFLVRDVAQLVLDRRISGVPVMEGQRLAGIVSESDLLHRHEIGTERAAAPGGWWRRFVGRNPLPAMYVKSHGKRARDVMTRNVVWVPEDASLCRIADLLAARRIRRVPVMRDGRLVGIVTRADLVRALRARSDTPAARPRLNDDDIRNALLRELEQQPWWRASLSVVYVDAGVVCFRGFVDSEAERHAARIAAENVPGVRAVQDRRTNSADWTPMV